MMCPANKKLIEDLKKSPLTYIEYTKFELIEQADANAKEFYSRQTKTLTNGNGEQSQGNRESSDKTADNIPCDCKMFIGGSGKLCPKCVQEVNEDIGAWDKPKDIQTYKSELKEKILLYKNNHISVTQNNYSNAHYEMGYKIGFDNILNFILKLLSEDK